MWWEEGCRLPALDSTLKSHYGEKDEQRGCNDMHLCTRYQTRALVRVRPTPADPRIARAPGGSTLGPEQVEPGADFTQLGMTRFRAELGSLTLEELEFLSSNGPTDLIPSNELSLKIRLFQQATRYIVDC